MIDGAAKVSYSQSMNIIEDDALAGYSHEECFNMGVEWCFYARLISNQEKFEARVYMGNARRLEDLAKQNGLEVELVYFNDYYTDIIFK